MKKSILYTALYLLSLHVYSQSEAVYSHALINPVIYNPGFTGWDEFAHVSLQVRSQWTGYNSSFDGSGGAPNMQALVASIPVEGLISGLGLTLLNENLGPVNSLSLGIPFSLQVGLQSGNLVFGATPGLISRTQRFDLLRFNDPGDPLNVGTRQTQTNFNLSAGIAYQYANSILVGVGATNLLEPSFNFGSSELQYEMKRSFNFIAGYRKTVGGNVRIFPSAFILSDLSKFSVDLGSLVYIGEKIWSGVYYRWSEAIILQVGYSLLPQNVLRIGFAFDLVFDQKSADQLTSQEIYVRYNLPEIALGGRKQVKTPRFTY